MENQNKNTPETVYRPDTGSVYSPDSAGQQANDNTGTKPTASPAPMNQPVYTPTAGADRPNPPQQPPSVPATPSGYAGYDYEEKPKGQKAYLVEYFLSLVITGTLIGLTLSFFKSIVDSIGEDGAIASAWGASFAYTSSLVAISTAVVFMAALMVVSRRCLKTEQTMPEVKFSRWRKGFLGLFLVILGLSALGSAVTMVYNIISLVASMGVTAVDFGETAKSIATSTFSFIVLTSTLMLYTQDYRAGNMNKTLSMLHHYGLILGVLVLTILFFAMPLRAHRDSFIDGIASRDIRSLNRLVDDYASENKELPEDLSALRLKGDIDGRADNYEYIPEDSSYKLCAEFRTDTTENKAVGNPLENALSGSLYRSSYSTSNNPNYHKKGRQCFDYDAPVSSLSRPSLFGDGDYGDLQDYEDYSDYR